LLFLDICCSRQQGDLFLIFALEAMGRSILRYYDPT